MVDSAIGVHRSSLVTSVSTVCEKDQKQKFIPFFFLLRGVRIIFKHPNPVFQAPLAGGRWQTSENFGAHFDSVCVSFVCLTVHLETRSVLPFIGATHCVMFHGGGISCTV